VEPPRTGLLESLRRLAATGLEIVAVRIELLGTELELEKDRLFGALVLAAVGLVLVALALVLLIAFVLMLVQDRYRVAAVGVLLLAFAGGGAWLLQAARRRMRGGSAFVASLGELRRDLDRLGAGEPRRAQDPADER
jgi:uncharacterized membrane protein YqjE